MLTTKFAAFARDTDRQERWVAVVLAVVFGGALVYGATGWIGASKPVSQEKLAALSEQPCVAAYVKARIEAGAVATSYDVARAHDQCSQDASEAAERQRRQELLTSQANALK